MAKSSWREQRIQVLAATPYPLTWFDTRPNLLMFSNNSNTRVYISVSRNVGLDTYDLILPAYGTRILARPDPIDTCWLYAAVDAKVYVASLEAEFNPLLISQTQETSAVAASGLLGTVDVQSILNPLPAGTNQIGSVQVAGFGVPLPAGTNNIGDVDVVSLPSLPAGGNNIGDVDVASLPSGTWTAAAQATTDAYADLGSAWNTSQILTKTVVLANTGANGAFVKVLGSVNGVDWDVEILAEKAVAAGAKEIVKIPDYYTHVKVQIKAQTAGSQTTVAGRGAGIGA